MGSLSSFALSIISAAILSRYFDKDEYGTYRQILYVYNTLLVIFTAGLPSVFAYYLPRYNRAQGKSIVYKTSKVLFFAGFLFSIFLFSFSGVIAIVLRNPELAKGLKCFSPIPMLLLPTLGIEGIFSTYKQTIFIAVYNFLSRILMLLFIILPVIFLNGSYLHAIYGWITASIITFYIAYIFKSIPFKGLKAEESNLSLKEVFRYCTPLAIASLAGIAIKAADQFFISRFFGTTIFAEFSNGFIQLPFVGMVTGATSTVLMPVFSKIIHEKSNRDQLLALWQNSLKKSAIIIYPMVIYFIVFSKETTILIYSSKYELSAIYFSIAMVINFFNVIVFAPLLLSLGETHFYARLHIYFAGIAWLFGYIVVIIFKNPIATAIFSAILSICIITVAIIFTAKRLNISIVKLFPIGKLSMIGLHSTLSIFFVRSIISRLDNTNNISILLISLLFYIPILILLSSIFQIKYLSIIKSVMMKQEKVNLQNNT